MVDDAVQEVIDNTDSGSRTNKTVSAVMKRKRREARALRDPGPLEAMGIFATVVVDPPWKLEKIVLNEGANKYEDKDLKYETMELDDIKGLKIPEILADDAWCFLWTTNAYLPDAFDVLKAWGVSYRYCMAWIKDQGFRQTGQPETRCEFLLDRFGRQACMEAGQGVHDGP